MTICVLQARTGSSRLPGKVIKPLAGIPMLAFQLKRIKEANEINQILIATTTNTADDAIVEIGRDYNVAVFQGSENDVLDRFYQALIPMTQPDDIIVRVTGDCPFLDPQILDQVIQYYKAGTFDYVSNVNPPTYPDGLDVEVFSFSSLVKAWQEAKLKSEREHVTPYIRNHPELFVLGNVENDKDISNIRLTVDEEADYELAQQLVMAIFPSLEYHFCLKDVMDVIEKNPSLLSINNQYDRNEGYIASLAGDKSNGI